MVHVPATMALLGRANWWLPTWLDRLLSQLRVEGHVATPAAAAPTPVPAPVPVPVRRPFA